MMMTVPALPTLWTRLQVGGWQIGFWIDSGGRTYVDVASPQGTLVYRGGGSRPGRPSIDAGWTGWGTGPDRETRCWALAVGRLSANLGDRVSFVSRAGDFPADQDRGALLPDGRAGLWITEDGLWVATATGSCSRVRLTAFSDVRLTSATAALQFPLVPVGAG